MAPTIRALDGSHRQPLAQALAEIPLFTPEEVSCALELVDIYLNDPAQKDYQALVALDEEGALLGFACYGPVPLTSGSFDLYWIAVAPSRQRRGVGTLLLRRVEDEVQRSGARMLLVETSGREEYEGTRSFYGGNGYREASRIADYYSPGDDCLLFQKRFP